ncbi:hypothetical protein E2C01_023435 [Portunus trituberculatus]|uniref:Uncharacterized protein n=1 Tax=Portunus trituberculatus TaxID=210409 RepID=A0A5B7E9Z6_PORTR|nr:hypothetical protein [Portunus trituberculatus]
MPPDAFVMARNSSTPWLPATLPPIIVTSGTCKLKKQALGVTLGHTCVWVWWSDERWRSSSLILDSSAPALRDFSVVPASCTVIKLRLPLRGESEATTATLCHRLGYVVIISQSKLSDGEVSVSQVLGPLHWMEPNDRKLELTSVHALHSPLVMSSAMRCVVTGVGVELSFSGWCGAAGRHSTCRLHAGQPSTLLEAYLWHDAVTLYVPLVVNVINFT